jgi:hypothetical protein
VHARQTFLADLTLVESGVDLVPRLEQRVHVPRQLHPGPERPRALLRFVDLDHQRAAELTESAEQFVVGSDLVQDVGLAHDALDAHDLLDLIAHGLGVLEQEH